MKTLAGFPTTTSEQTGLSLTVQVKGKEELKPVNIKLHYSVY